MQNGAIRQNVTYRETKGIIQKFISPSLFPLITSNVGCQRRSPGCWIIWLYNPGAQKSSLLTMDPQIAQEIWLESWEDALYLSGYSGIPTD